MDQGKRKSVFDRALDFLEEKRKRGRQVKVFSLDGPSREQQEEYARIVEGHHKATGYYKKDFLSAGSHYESPAAEALSSEVATAAAETPMPQLTMRSDLQDRVKAGKVSEEEELRLVRMAAEGALSPTSTRYVKDFLMMGRELLAEFQEFNAAKAADPSQAVGHPKYAATVLKGSRGKSA